MSNKESNSTVFIEGQPAGIKPSSPYSRFAYDNLKVPEASADKDQSITRAVERAQRLECLRIAAMSSNSGVADSIVDDARRFWEFAREGK